LAVEPSCSHQQWKERTMQHVRNRKLKALVAALATAVLVAPVAQAGIQTDARHQALVDKATRAGLDLDKRPRSILVKAPEVKVDPQHTILLMHRHAGELNYTTHANVSGSTQSVSGDGMDWGDAGIGAGAAFGAVLLGAAGAFVGRKKLAHA
jgi:hypothetical protein